MKLEIKHLVPYLPYGINVSINGYIQKMNSLDFASKLVCYGWGSAGFIDEDDIKPILRPLSDLSKLGVDDITINEHTINLMIEEKFNEDYGLFEHYKGSLELVKEGDSSQGYDSSKAISFEVFEEIRNELLKGHYDLFGLIESGLAIDMNLINNQ